MLTAPDGETWLEERLDRFPEGPCFVLLRRDDLGAARREYPLREPRDWPVGDVAVVETDVLGYRLGVVERKRGER